MLQVLAWLKLKAAATARALHDSGGAFGGMDEAALRSYSVNMLGDYLPPHWLARLQEASGLSPAGAQPQPP